ncbi:MAG: adenylate/guanylate cyclase domain-containing protein [Gammaproteobacteria bacterium]|nr:adenylate/guanylate cyclase domain-containing protein [Gammaproteobacteria bacterium]
MLAVLAALMVAVLPMAFFLARKLLFPLQELAAKSQLMTDHNKVISFTLERDDEIGQLANSLDKMPLRLTHCHHKMTKIAYQDELTSLANRRCFNDFLKKLWLNGQ